MSYGPEDLARFRLYARSYRIHSGAVWYVLEDDPECLDEVLVANWDGTVQDCLEALEVQGWPTSPFILCSCGDGEADLGGLCSFCMKTWHAEQRAGV